MPYHYHRFTSLPQFLFLSILLSGYVKKSSAVDINNVYKCVHINTFPNNPLGDWWLSDSSFVPWSLSQERRLLYVLLPENTLSPLTFDLSPPPVAIATCYSHDAAVNHMRVSVRMCFWLQTYLDGSYAQGIRHLGFITSRNNMHLHTTYGGMRRACTREQMTTRAVARARETGFGSARNETTPA